MGPPSTVYPGFVVPGGATRSSWDSSPTADEFIALGGRSSGPLRPQPPSTSADALRTMMAHPAGVRRQFDFTTKIPNVGRTIQRLPGSGETWTTMKLQRNL